VNPSVGDSALWQQFEPFPFEPMAWRDYLEVPAVQGGDLVQVEPFGERYHAGIHGLEPQRGIRGEQLRHPPIVVRCDLDYPNLVIGDGGAEFGNQADAPAPLRISQQMTYLGDGKRRNHQARPVSDQELRATDVIAVSLVECCDHLYRTRSRGRRSAGIIPIRIGQVLVMVAAQIRWPFQGTDQRH
jgi:hypothetical protein